MNDKIQTLEETLQFFVERKDAFDKLCAWQQRQEYLRPWREAMNRKLAPENARTQRMLDEWLRGGKPAEDAEEFSNPEVWFARQKEKSLAEKPATPTE